MSVTDNTRKRKVTCTVSANEKIAEGVYSMLLQYPEGSAPEIVKPGQFVGVYTNDPSRLLPRPISICGWNEEKKELRLVYRTAGKGTTLLSEYAVGTETDVLGILGNGYDVSTLTGRKVLLIGGGIGAPPLLGIANAVDAANRLTGKEGEITAVLGYRTNDLFLKDEFASVSRVVIATDDGTAGVHGNVIEAVRQVLMEDGRLDYDVICSCGPLPMLKGVKALSQETGVPAFLSLEERMACGVGACLGCVTKTVKKDAHSHVNNARICTEGPVFNAEDVEL